MKFRKRPVVIEAVKFINEPTEIDGQEPEWYRVARTIDTEEVGSISYSKTFGSLLIHTLEGVMCARQGDWIIRGISGEVYPCKPDIFEQTYECAETPEAKT